MHTHQAKKLTRETPDARVKGLAHKTDKQYGNTKFKANRVLLPKLARACEEPSVYQELPLEVKILVKMSTVADSSDRYDFLTAAMARLKNVREQESTFAKDRKLEISDSKTVSDLAPEKLVAEQKALNLLLSQPKLARRPGAQASSLVDAVGTEEQAAEEAKTTKRYKTIPRDSDLSNEAKFQKLIHLCHNLSVREGLAPEAQILITTYHSFKNLLGGFKTNNVAKLGFLHKAMQLLECRTQHQDEINRLTTLTEQLESDTTQASQFELAKKNKSTLVVAEKLSEVEEELSSLLTLTPSQLQSSFTTVKRKITTETQPSVEDPAAPQLAGSAPFRKKAKLAPIADASLTPLAISTSSSSSSSSSSTAASQTHSQVMKLLPLAGGTPSALSAFRSTAAVVPAPSPVPMAGAAIATGSAFAGTLFATFPHIPVAHRPMVLTMFTTDWNADPLAVAHRAAAERRQVEAQGSALVPKPKK